MDERILRRQAQTDPDDVARARMGRCERDLPVEGRLVIRMQDVKRMLLIKFENILKIDMDLICQVTCRKDTADLPAPAEENQKILGKTLECVSCLC